VSDFTTGPRTDPGARPPIPDRGDQPSYGPTDRGPAPAPAHQAPAAAGPGATTARAPGYPAGSPGGPTAPTAAAARPPAANGPDPAEVKGRIHIADEVVEKVAALAAIEVEGVADLGGDVERAIESVRERIGLGSKRGDQGVKADVKGHEVSVNVTIMVEFGHVVLDVARRVQANVAAQTTRMLGLRVVEVNVTVDDVRTSRPEAEEGDGDGDVR
jgi:uncharacterized alkaline shock family protein YloU